MLRKEKKKYEPKLREDDAAESQRYGNATMTPSPFQERISGFPELLERNGGFYRIPCCAAFLFAIMFV